MSQSASPPASPTTQLITARDALQTAHDSYIKAVKRFAENDPTLSPSTVAQKRKIMKESNTIIGKIKKDFSKVKFSSPSKVTTAPSSSSKTRPSSAKSNSKHKTDSLNAEGEDEDEDEDENNELTWQDVLDKISDASKTYYQDNVVPLWKTPTLAARDFKTSLEAFPHTDLDMAESELHAVQRLLGAYVDNWDNWNRHLQLFKGSQQSYQQACLDAQTNDGEQDENKKLRNIETRLRKENSINAGEQFVWFVLRTIESLRYIKIWNEHNTSRKWKTDLIEETFADEFPELSTDETPAGKKKKKKMLTKYKRTHTAIIKARRELLSLYEKFGPGILLDRVWDVDKTRRGTRRSGGFHDLVVLLCADNAHFVEATPVAECNMSQHADSLYQILSILASKEVAEYVKDFMVHNPPNVPDDYEYGWGLSEED